VSFTVVDQCEELYVECQGDADCKAIDDCVLNEACVSSGCLAGCRDLGPSASRATFDSMYNCACGLCNDDCDTGDSCN